MRISQKKMLDCHMESLDQTVSHLSARLSRTSFEDSSISSIILVGEYAECGFLQEYLAKRFPTQPIIVPKMPSEAVPKGAILHACYCDK